MQIITVQIKFFGVFRKLGSAITLEIPAGLTVHGVKQKLWQALGAEHQQLVEDSVLASQTSVLPEAYVISQAAELAVLPPVCGG